MGGSCDRKRLMLNTKLILIEGLPGSGKSTVARHLGTNLHQHGLACSWYLEEDEPHPIACLDFPLKELAHKLPPLWHMFTEQLLQAQSVAIIESRLWQNTALFMYMRDYPVEEILQLQRLVCEKLAPLAPVLLYLDQDNVELALRRLYTLRDEAQINADIQMTSEYPWFQSRGLSDFAGWVQFFQDWQGTAEQLYSAWPYQKIRVSNAHDGWATAYQQIYHFLGLGPNLP